MLRAVAISLVIGVLAAGCQAAGEPGTAEPEPSIAQPAAPPPNASHIPAGTVLVGTLADELGARETKVGDAFTVTVQNALVAENRETVVPAGAVITGLVTGIGRAGGLSAIRLNFTRIALDGASHPFTAAITATRLPHDSDASTDESAGAPLGAVIDEGELRDALIEDALGAGAGTILSLGSGASQVLPSGTEVTLQAVGRIDLGTR